MILRPADVKFLLVSLVLGVLAFAGCAKEKDEARYELVRSDKGLVRMDKETGEMIALNGSTPTSIDLTSASEATEIDPLLSVVKTFPVFVFPGATRDLKVKIDYRWIKGRMDYRFSVTPYADDLNGLLRDPANQLILAFQDSDSFEIKQVKAPLASMIRMVDSGKKPSFWQSADSFAISKADYQRIVDVTYSWGFTDALDKALNK